MYSAPCSGRPPCSHSALTLLTQREQHHCCLVPGDSPATGQSGTCTQSRQQQRHGVHLIRIKEICFPFPISSLTLSLSPHSAVSGFHVTSDITNRTSVTSCCSHSPGSSPVLRWLQPTELHGRERTSAGETASAVNLQQPALEIALSDLKALS